MEESRRQSGHHASCSSRQGTPLPAGELIAETLKVYATFSPDRVSLDAHLECLPKALAHGDDAQFARQSCYGLVRYKKLFSRFLDGFYAKNSASASREDGSLFRHVC